MLTRAALACVWLLRLLPLAVLAAIGNGFGTLLYALGRERRRICLINLARCLPELPERKRVALALRELGQATREVDQADAAALAAERIEQRAEAVADRGEHGERQQPEQPDTGEGGAGQHDFGACAPAGTL